MMHHCAWSSSHLLCDKRFVVSRITGKENRLQTALLITLIHRQVEAEADTRSLLLVE